MFRQRGKRIIFIQSQCVYPTSICLCYIKDWGFMKGRMSKYFFWLHVIYFLGLCFVIFALSSSPISDLWIKWSWEKTCVGFIVLNRLNLPFGRRISVPDYSIKCLDKKTPEASWLPLIICLNNCMSVGKKVLFVFNFLCSQVYYVTFYNMILFFQFYWDIIDM